MRWRYQTDCERPTPRLMGPGSALGSRIAGLPEGTFADDLALHATNRILVDAVAEVEEVHVEALGEFVDGLLQGESPLGMTGSAEGGGRTGVDEDVVFFGVQRGPFIEVRGRTGASGSGAAAGGAVADELNGGDGAVFLRADAEALIGAGTIADGEMLLLAVEHEANRRSGFARERGGNDSRIAGAELGAETTAHVFGDDAHLGFGKMEVAGKLFAHAGGSLGGGIDGEQLGLPVGDHAVGFKRGVRLHLGDVAGIHNHVGVFESLFGIALLAHRRPMDIAGLGSARLRFRLRRRFLPRSAAPGKTRGALGSRARSASTTKGSASYFTLTLAAASSAA